MRAQPGGGWFERAIYGTAGSRNRLHVPTVDEFAVTQLG